MPHVWWKPARRFLLVTAVLASTACSTSSPISAPSSEPRLQRVPEELAGYLLSPLASFPEQIDTQRADRLMSAHAGLVEGGLVESAGRTAKELLAIDPGLHPATLLAAEAAAAEGHFAMARDLLVPVTVARPNYVPARLLLGRSFEALGNLPDAYEELRSIASRNELAARHAGELREPAAEALAQRVRQALEEGNSASAERSMAQLESWAPEAPRTLETRLAVAAAKGDGAGELATLRRLVPQAPERDDWITRQADLELELGQPGTAMELLQRLAATHREDPQIAEKLARATFRWRLGLLPASVKSQLDQPALSRAGFASLLYWLIPEVRYGKPAGGRIATDILELAERDAVARVINLGLMKIDPTLHLFAPRTPVSRAQALDALLAVLALRTASCLPRGGIPSSPLCPLARACGLVTDPEGCERGDTVSGQEAAELIRLSLQP